MGVGFCHRTFLWCSCGFYSRVEFSYMVEYVYWFMYFKSSLHVCMEAELIMIDNLFKMFLNLVLNEIGMKWNYIFHCLRSSEIYRIIILFSCFLFDFGITTILACKNNLDMFIFYFVEYLRSIRLSCFWRSDIILCWIHVTLHVFQVGDF